MVRPIKNFLSTLIAQKGDWKVRLMQQWPIIIGELSDQVTIEKVVGDTLVLGVYDSCWMQELYMLSPMLLGKIHAHGYTHIKDIRFKTVTKALPFKQKAPSLPARTVPKNISLTPQQSAVLDRIADQELRSALKAFLIRCYQE
ncbi:MAG TPA: DUF721 domain-containing protein [Candidatus Dependentiae bacterium]|nr:DUF721 domain-containing protein [Candidatus Dependentiae bacterium]HRQ62740.1 DUF721 domain-containing protein [Candidatus Dependentiae bacterium]